MTLIDFRSDTVTQPSAAMRQAMTNAPVGDDVWGDDPTVAALQLLAAEKIGKEAGLFVPSGTQSNLVALLTHCQRGDEYLVGQEAHVYRYEGGGAAVFGSIQPQPLPVQADGSIALEQLRSAIKPDDFHFARTRLLCLENTIHGRVLPQDYVVAACALADAHGLAKHLDGARLFNAAVARGVEAKVLAQPFDTVSLCLSKGLGAPVGSVLCGTAEFIQEAKRWRKMLGGGMRQAGIIAAAGVYALQHNIDRLTQDHAAATLLAQELAAIPQLRVDLSWVQTNMVFVTPEAGTSRALSDALAAQGMLVDAGDTIRLVTHLQAGEAQVRALVAAVQCFYQ